jgi:uncharacterized membrane protein YfcA
MALILVVTATFLTSLLSGVLGMGGGIILAGILSILLTLPMALTMHAIVQFTANSYRAYLLRQDIEWRIVSRFLIGLVVAASLFTAMPFTLSKPYFYLMLGTIALSSHYWPKSLAFNAQKTSHSVLCGLSVTTLQLYVGVAGPLLDVFFQRTKLNRFQIVATKAMTQSLGHFTRIGLYVAVLKSYWVDAHLSIETILALMILALLGTRLGRELLKQLNELNFKSYSRRLLMAVGVVFIYKGLSALY